ncbi:hypothetical protein F5Y08DRAFT_339470 [Xylaria arbuscula]|nr:hypothetical protein F5Y08DRAFT_339470 [Xylaria arbuscula]
MLKDSRFNAGDWGVVNDDMDEEKREWSCCHKGEHDSPPKDWQNVRYSRGDPKRYEGVRDPPPPLCPPTFHEPEEGFAGWTGWWTVRSREEDWTVAPGFGNLSRN